MASESSAVVIPPESPQPVQSFSSFDKNEDLEKQKDMEQEDTSTTRIVTPSSIESEVPVNSTSPPMSPTEAYARHIQSTSASSQASARKAELEELRSRNLAKNRKKGIHENADHVPFSSTEIESFFLEQKKQGQEWKKKQRETYESLHSYRNDEIQAHPGEKKFYFRDIPDSTQGGAYTTLSELDRFFQQQRAVHKHQRKQHQDSLNYLRSYRQPHKAGDGENETSSDVGSDAMLGGSPVDVMFGDIVARMRANLLEARTCPLPESPPSEPCLELATENETKEIPLYNSSSENVLEEVAVIEESPEKEIEEMTEPVEEVVQETNSSDAEEDKVKEIGDLMIPEMFSSPGNETEGTKETVQEKSDVEIDSEKETEDATTLTPMENTNGEDGTNSSGAKEDNVREIGDLVVPEMFTSSGGDSEGIQENVQEKRGLDNDSFNDQMNRESQETPSESPDAQSDEIEATDAQDDGESTIEENHENKMDDEEEVANEDIENQVTNSIDGEKDEEPQDTAENDSEMPEDLDNENTEEEEGIVPKTEDESPTEMDILENTKDDTELTEGDNITQLEDDIETPPSENMKDEVAIDNPITESPEKDSFDLTNDDEENGETENEVTDGTDFAKVTEEKKDESQVDESDAPSLAEEAADDDVKEDETDLLLDDILCDDSIEDKGEEVQPAEEGAVLKKEIPEANDSQANGEDTTSALAADDDDDVLDSLLDDDEENSKVESAMNPAEVAANLTVSSPPLSVEQSPSIRQKSGVETSEKEEKMNKQKAAKANETTPGRRKSAVTFSPLTKKASRSQPKASREKSIKQKSPIEKSIKEKSPKEKSLMENSSTPNQRLSRSRSASPWKKRPAIQPRPRHASLSRATNASNASKRLGFNTGSGRGLVPEVKHPSCSTNWVSDVHQSRAGCSRCLKLASQEERDKYEAKGHHHRINSTRGGCYRTCQFFPKTASEAPIRLCRKCFYTTHDSKTGESPRKFFKRDFS